MKNAPALNADGSAIETPKGRILFFEVEQETAASVGMILSWVLLGIVVLRFFDYDVIGMIVEPIQGILGMNEEEDPKTPTTTTP